MPPNNYYGPADHFAAEMAKVKAEAERMQKALEQQREMERRKEGLNDDDDEPIPEPIPDDVMNQTDMLKRAASLFTRLERLYPSGNVSVGVKIRGTLRHDISEWLEDFGGYHGDEE